MPKVNTFNYDTIASWNGSEDLFVIEQPDGTKVATPAMVKQFIEAGDFEATGEVKDGHGNILADMAKADEVKGIVEAGDFEATGEVKDGHGNILADMAKTLNINSTSFDIASELPVGKSAAVIVSDSNLCTVFAGDTNSLSGVVSRLANNVYAWNLATYNYKFVYVRTDASFTVGRRFYAAGTSF